MCPKILINTIFSGIWLHPNGVLGASPDGLIRIPALYNWNYQTLQVEHVLPGVLEVKCPYTARDMTVAEAIAKLKDFFVGLYSAKFWLK